MKRFDEIRNEYQQRCTYVDLYKKMSLLNDEQKEKLCRYQSVKEKTEAVFDSLPEAEREILHRYIDGEDRWYQKATVEMSMSKTTVYRLLKKAINTVENLYDRT